VVVLPVGAVLRLLKRCRLVYDTHELESETKGKRGLPKMAAKTIERCLIRYADLVVVVGDAIAEWYRREYPRAEVCVAKNVPYLQNGDVPRTGLLREKLGIPEDDVVFIYQGTFAYGRAIHLILDAFARVPRDRHVVLMGFGNQLELVKRKAEELPNVHFFPAVPPSEVARYAAEADVGLSIIENLCLSYYYCLPNKVFTCLGVGVPVIVSDFPEMGKVIDDHGCGWKVAVDEDQLVRLVERLTPEEIEEKRRAALACRDDFAWENEEPALLSAYRRMGPARGRHPRTPCAKP
jgi:glycosyltransferase involved in cell wall biosynthesis